MPPARLLLHPTARRSPLHECPPPEDNFLEDVVRGLSATPKTLPCKYLYDRRGSELFDRICQLEEYYPTRTELRIMELQGDSMAWLLGSGTLVIEFGSGSSLKTRLLLDCLNRPAGYVPIDISKEHLLESAETLQVEYPHIPVHPVWADFTLPLSLPPAVESYAPRLVYFPGSTIGNFSHGRAKTFLHWIHDLVGNGGELLIGVDLKKDPYRLLRAYDDSRGVTAAFNLNLLERIKRELDADIEVENFRHEARWNSSEGRIEMHLVARRPCQFRVNGSTFHFMEEESIWTESSYKYTPHEFQMLALDAGFRAHDLWIDPDNLFSVHLLRAIA
jgi:dimethylhistidine N-methyltransferase